MKSQKSLPAQVGKIKSQKLLSQRGQIVLIIVLITVVGLTIGLSLISRTVRDIRISTQIEQSNRAFSAAEAGIESALKGNLAAGPTGVVSLPGASANYSVLTQGGVAGDAFYLPPTEVGSTQTVWMVPHDENGIINIDTGVQHYNTNRIFSICWGAENTTNSPAVILSVIYKGTSGDINVAKGAFDPDPGRGNGFDTQNVNIALGPDNFCNNNFRFKRDIFIKSPGDGDPNTYDLNIEANAKLIMVRLQPVYYPTALAIQPEINETIQDQSKLIISVGKTDTGVIRKIQVIQGYTELPSLLDYALFEEE